MAILSRRKCLDFWGYMNACDAKRFLCSGAPELRIGLIDRIEYEARRKELLGRQLGLLKTDGSETSRARDSAPLHSGAAGGPATGAGLAMAAGLAASIRRPRRRQLMAWRTSGGGGP